MNITLHTGPKNQSRAISVNGEPVDYRYQRMDNGKWTLYNSDTGIVIAENLSHRGVEFALSAHLKAEVAA